VTLECPPVIVASSPLTNVAPSPHKEVGPPGRQAIRRREVQFSMFHRIAAAVSAAALLLTVAVSAEAAGGPPKLSFYVDDVRYRTVGTPTDFTNTGAPDLSFDKIYALGSGLINVAEAKPGDTDFNGGRWQVYAITWHIAPVQYTNDADILAAAQAGDISISADPVREFFCNVAPVPPSWN
jgi:hypothetical protein